MARRRMIDPSFWDSAFGKKWSANTAIVMIAAISAADDEGRGRISSIHRNVESMMTHEQFTESLTELSESIVKYDKLLYYIPKWETYQTINRPSCSLFPKPPEMNDSVNDSRLSEVKRSEEKRSKETNTCYSPDFEKFWEAYPKRTGNPKAAAWKSYQAALKKGFKQEDILIGATNYTTLTTRERTEMRFIKHASTWLNQECFRDLKTLPAQSQTPSLASDAADLRAKERTRMISELENRRKGLNNAQT